MVRGDDHGRMVEAVEVGGRLLMVGVKGLVWLGVGGWRESR